MADRTDIHGSRAARVGRWCAVAAGLTTLAAVILAVTQAAPQRWPLVSALVGALLWGLGGSIAVALIPIVQPGPAQDRRVEGLDGHVAADGAADLEGSLAEDVRFGTLMYLGRVPDQVALMTSAIASTWGPVSLMVPPGRVVPVGLDPAVVVVEADRPDTARKLTSFHEKCDAVLVVSARAFPTTGCDTAAHLVAEGASWVQGRSEPLNRDRFGPSGRGDLDSGLRTRATAAGLWCWQPDATIVEASLLREHPLESGRPWGSWLRERAAEGAGGVTVDIALTRRAAPVAADGYWPDTTARQCAGAADLSAALLCDKCSARARVVAAGLLARALSGWSVLWWLVALALLADGSPVRTGGGALAALLVVSAVLRWVAPRLASGSRPSPVLDIVAWLYALPGSLAATGSAISRRVRPPHRAVPTRPLVWLALVGLAATACVLLTAEPGDSAARVAAGLAAAMLVLTWVLTVRSLIERSWRRVGFRIPLDLPAIVTSGGDDGSPSPGWRLVDGGSGGFALAGPATGSGLGDELTVQVSRADHEVLTLHGAVAGIRRDVQGRELLGVELRTVEPGSAAWARMLVDAASLAPLEAVTASVDEDVPRDSWGHRIDRLAIGLVLAASLVVAVTLLSVLVGVRPLVIRSGSMVPTYNVGDVVVVASEPAGAIREQQVVTRFDAPEAMDSLTHRVIRLTRSGDEVQVETRGDANETSELWSVPAQRPVGVVVASVPAIGLPFTEVRSSIGWAVAVAGFVLVVIVVLLRPGRRPTGQGPNSGGSLTQGGHLPNRSEMTTIGEQK